MAARKTSKSTIGTAQLLGKDSVTLINNRTGEQFQFPIVDGTEGPSLIDVSSLYSQTGMFTYDPGFTSTGFLQVRNHFY